MNFKFRFKKRGSSMVTLIACAAFIWLAIARLGLPKEKVLQWLVIILVLLLVLVLLAALTALLIRWLIGNKNQ